MESFNCTKGSLDYQYAEKWFFLITVDSNVCGTQNGSSVACEPHFYDLYDCSGSRKILMFLCKLFVDYGYHI